MIPNPDYSYDDDMYKVCKEGCTHVGFEIWQVKTGTLFDDILVTDSLEEAEAFAQETFFKKKDGEKEMYDEHMEKQRAEEEDMVSPLSYVYELVHAFLHWYSYIFLNSLMTTWETWTTLTWEWAMNSRLVVSWIGLFFSLSP